MMQPEQVHLIRQKPSVRMFLRVSLGLAVVGLVVGTVANLGFYTNGDFLPEEVRGPHPLAGALGEVSFQIAIFVIPGAMVMSFFGLPLSFFRAPVTANFLATLGGLLLSTVAWHINTGGLMRIRGNPVRRQAVEVTKLGTLIDRYAREHGGYLPIPGKWCETLIEFDPNAARHLSYPRARDGPLGFSMLALNDSLEGKRLADVPSGVVLLFGTQPAQNPLGDRSSLMVDSYAGGGTLVLFADLHLEFVRTEDFDHLRWEP